MTDGSPLEITDGNFEDTIKSKTFVVVDCWAPWCMPCRMLGPTIEALAAEYAGKDVAFGKLNTDDNPTTASKFGIMAIPTILYFKNGELVDRTTGVMPKGDIEKVIGKHA